jgi:hypothetical protein
MKIIKRVHITPGQEYLYRTICDKISGEDKLTLKEAREMYIAFGCRDVRNGIPYCYNYWWRNEKGDMVGRSEPMTEDMIKTAVVMWLTHNIGSLVLKGYLTILPALELS